MPNQHTRRKGVIFPVGPSIVYVPLSRGQFSIIDSSSMEEVKKYNWYASWSKGGKCFYAVRNFVVSPGKWERISLHSLLLGNKEGFMIDHMNGITLDNRLSNLRHATRSQNVCNQKLRINRKGFLKGAHWHKGNKTWTACIGLKGKHIHLGTFRSQEEAHAAYKNASLELHREFSRFS